MKAVPPRLRRQFRTHARWYWWRVIRLREDEEIEEELELLAEIDFIGTPVYKIGGVTVLPGTIMGDSTPSAGLSFNEANIGAEGYDTSGDDYFAAKGDLLDLILAGNALIIEWKQKTETTAIPVYAFDYPDESTGVQVTASRPLDDILFLSGIVALSEMGPTGQFLDAVGSINKAACVLGFPRTDASLNGNADLLGASIEAGDWDDELINSVFIAYSGGFYIRRIHVVAAPASGGLAALSEL
jgi:hypothetical protein